MKLFYFYLFLALELCVLQAEPPKHLFPDMQRTLVVNNAILAKFHNKTISVIDVLKKMDFLFHQTYPDLVDSQEARFHFYQASWKHILNEMIHNELILADAKDKELKVTDAEVKEEIEHRYGPNILITLDNIGITLDDAKKMVKEEMLVQRMSWYRINSKAMQAVTPQKIREAFRAFCSATPPEEHWEYQILTIQSKDALLAKQLAEKTYQLTLNQDKTPEQIKEAFAQLDSENKGSCQLSNLYEISGDHLSKAYKQILSHLKENSYSKPVLKKNQANQETAYRIFYLKKLQVKEPASFSEMANKLKDELLQKEFAKYSEEYLSKLKKFYGVDQQITKLPEDFQPFAIQ